jgi:hypothetical protein
MLKYLLLLLVTQPAFANTLYFRYGVGVFDSQKTGAVKTFALGYQRPLGRALTLQSDVGLFTDSGPGRKSSLTLSQSIGPRTNIGPVHMAALWGAALVPTPDANRLSGRFQFVNDIILEVRGKNGVGFGVSYRHLSNAGIELPNKGRDMVTFRMSYSF